MDGGGEEEENLSVFLIVKISPESSTS